MEFDITDRLTVPLSLSWASKSIKSDPLQVVESISHHITEQNMQENAPNTNRDITFSQTSA